MKYIKRLLVLPFIAGIIFVKYTWGGICRCIDFMKYGGEFINYRDFNEHKTIDEVYRELQKYEHQQRRTNE